PYNGQVLRASELVGKQGFELGSVLDEIIDKAIANRGFKIYYQPIYSIAEKKFVSAEALLRLKDETYGFISPELFIVAAERSGAIHKIGDYVMDEVCRFIASDEYKRLGLEYIEVNLSVAQCMSPDLAEKILHIMRRHNVSPDSINLEITETAMSYAQNTMTENIQRLYDAGLSFSLDDYGTGYSNINRVASLPLKIVKLDKSFVDSEGNPKMWIVLQNTVKMIKDMDMHIVVEGIETKQVLEKFAGLKCDYIQGYYFSKPIPEEEFVEFILANMKK
ncbi:MAG: EAL domain-containing protein, partial [Oscillospiraceae bacterium]|nr:EAL domain-containing protein [Oscillospiraceae bacterium]